MLILTLGQGAAQGVVTPPEASSQSGTEMEKAAVAKKVYDKTEKALLVVRAGTASGSYGTKMDVSQIFRSIYDPVNQAIRVVFV